jgi:hypothetical protein
MIPGKEISSFLETTGGEMPFVLNNKSAKI